MGDLKCFAGYQFNGFFFRYFYRVGLTIFAALFLDHRMVVVFIYGAIFSGEMAEHFSFLMFNSKHVRGNSNKQQNSFNSRFISGQFLLVGSNVLKYYFTTCLNGNIFQQFVGNWRQSPS